MNFKLKPKNIIKFIDDRTIIFSKHCFDHGLNYWLCTDKKNILNKEKLFDNVFRKYKRNGMMGETKGKIETIANISEKDVLTAYDCNSFIKYYGEVLISSSYCNNNIYLCPTENSIIAEKSNGF